MLPLARSHPTRDPVCPQRAGVEALAKTTAPHDKPLPPKNAPEHPLPPPYQTTSLSHADVGDRPPPNPADIESPHLPARSYPTCDLGPRHPTPQALMTSPSSPEACIPGVGPPPPTSSPQRASRCSRWPDPTPPATQSARNPPPSR
ncbi:hypothetical protein TIFTF001_031292 [Ficus carica]|uniref:Uncharacterized protein n=1 Tax=Ficus carica TaxID=3494 RepID=A0AA88DUK0_FICCA|nr:hypothetical protein TIFTF001_031292 [Ficus carica]